MIRRGLILAAHGSTTDTQVNEQVEHLAADVRDRVHVDEVCAAFYKGELYFSRVVDAMGADEIVIVPVMTSEGHYCDTVLPRELARNRRFADVRVRITAPVGVHPRVAELVAARVEMIRTLYAMDQRDVNVAVVGHGTARHAQSRRATIDLVEQLGDRNQFQDIFYAFLDEDPGIETIVPRSRGDLLVVVPFLIGWGHHTRVDLPQRLGMTDSAYAFPHVQRIGSRLVVCDQALGSYANLAGIVAELAGGFDPSAEPPGEHGASCDAGSHPEPRASARAAPRIPADARHARTYRLGTRGSPLALWQARHAAKRLHDAGMAVEVVEITTSGDRQHTTPLVELPSLSPFTDDLDDAVRSGAVDFAVHSMKDLPLELDPSLVVAAVLPRGDAREALVSHRGCSFSDLHPGATIGTSSPRRRAQILAMRPDLVPLPIRGAVDERVRQVEAGRFDAAVLALAGLERLGLQHKVSETFSVAQIMPAPAQAALAIVARMDHADARAAAARLNDDDTRRAVEAELAFLRSVDRLSNGYAAAAYAVASDRIHLAVRLIGLDGAVVVDAIAEGDDPESVGAEATRRVTASFHAPMEAVR